MKSQLHTPLIAMLLTSSACVLHCSSGRSTTSTPAAGGAQAGEDGRYQGWHRDAGAGGGTSSGGGGDTSSPSTGDRARDSISTRPAGSIKGVAKKLRPKAPPRARPDGESGKPKLAGASVKGKKGGGKKAAKIAVSGFVPTVGSPGTLVEISGEGFAPKAGENHVVVSGIEWEVTEAGASRLVAKVPADAKSGILEVETGNQKAKSASAFEVLKDDGGLGKPTRTTEYGLLGNVYRIGKPVTEIPAIDTLGEPVAVLAVENLDVPTRNFEQGFPGVDGTLVEWFAIHFKGALNVVEAGEYQLCLNSDDGSQLYLDSGLVVDNDGVHPTKETCSLVFMDPGEYALDVLYFQGPKFEIALSLKWGKDGKTPTVIPTEALFRTRSGDAAAAAAAKE